MSMGNITVDYPTRATASHTHATWKHTQPTQAVERPTRCRNSVCRQLLIKLRRMISNQLDDHVNVDNKVTR